MLGRDVNSINKSRKLVRKTSLNNKGNLTFTSFGIFGSGSGSPDGIESPADMKMWATCKICMIVLWLLLLWALWCRQYMNKNSVRFDENN